MNKPKMFMREGAWRCEYPTGDWMLAKSEDGSVLLIHEAIRMFAWLLRQRSHGKAV